MSNTDNTRTLHLHPAPDPEPLTGLTGAPAAIYTELVNSAGDTSAELALAAGLGRSTTQKALTTLEEHGLAIRTPGGHEGARRAPDRWSPAPAHTREEEQAQSAEVSEPDANDADTETTTPAPEGATAPSGATQDDVPDTLAEAEVSQCTVDSGEDAHADVPESTPCEPDKTDEPSATTTAPVAGQRARLAPGALRQMVITHLEAHPVEAFTATKISRVIEKSSGAIANACGSSGDSGEPKVTDGAVMSVLEELVSEGRVVRDGADAGEPCFRSVPPTPSGKQRRAPGQLRERVLQFLRERPGEEWGPTGISRKLEASSGAISNALDRLVKQGLARQTGECPRRFTSVAEAKMAE